MKLASLFFSLILLTSAPAFAKPKKAQKADPAKMSEVELRNTAESELRSPVVLPGAKVKPMASSPAPSSNDANLVSTDILRSDEQEPLAASEFEVGMQSYRPVGRGQISSGESYSFANLSAKPMFLVGGRHWFFQALRTENPLRVGLGVLGGFSPGTLKIQTNRGYVYDDVHLNSWLGLLGPEAEYFLDGRRRFAVGAKVSAGRLLTTQASGNSSINQSQGTGIWEAAGHLRYQPSSAFFVRAAYARRSNLGTEKGIEVQGNNFEALIGFGM